ncbi:hypothetical protein [Deinococcus actinosclerus]|uniref:Uncharacterized protein n=1 Tax=Deinococcus actinosclerus TaxID=1768108 RepID=A0ABM5X1E9_9DEIO|nr:hypothetical protein [Deinococcus actinosclerus]ALW87532.1 hypothetical protein AUC44_00315 [Deinococcus actinosclerus]
MKRGPLFPTTLLLLLGPLQLGAAHAQPAPDPLDGGDYAQVYARAQAGGDAVTASRAAAAMTEYRAGGRDWAARAAQAARQATAARPGDPDAQLALGSALGLQARAAGYTLGALNTAQQARAALDRALNLAPDRADIQAVLAEWHAGAWAKAGIFSGGNQERARTLATAAARRAPDTLFVQVHAGIALSLIHDPQARATLTRAVTLDARTPLDRDIQAQARRVLDGLKP